MVARARIRATAVGKRRGMVAPRQEQTKVRAFAGVGLGGGGNRGGGQGLIRVVPATKRIGPKLPGCSF